MRWLIIGLVLIGISVLLTIFQDIHLRRRRGESPLKKVQDVDNPPEETSRPHIPEPVRGSFPSILTLRFGVPVFRRNVDPRFEQRVS